MRPVEAPAPITKPLDDDAVQDALQAERFRSSPPAFLLQSAKPGA